MIRIAHQNYPLNYIHWGLNVCKEKVKGFIKQGGMYTLCFRQCSPMIFKICVESAVVAPLAFSLLFKSPTIRTRAFLFAMILPRDVLNSSRYLLSTLSWADKMNQDTMSCIRQEIQRTSDGGDGNHSVSLPIILIKLEVDQILPSSYISSLLVSFLCFCI